MSACIVFQQNKKSYVASDGAVSINFGEGNVRIKNDYKKTFCYENNLIFCSGRIRIVEVIVSEIKKKKDIKIEDIVQICRSNYAYEGLLELFLTKYDEGIISYQLSSYNNFTPIKRVIDENNTEVLSLGFNASRNLETIFKHVGKCKSIEEMIENIYRDICCEEVGGTVDIYEISSMGIKNILTINLKDRMTITERFVAEGNLIVAETIVGKLLVGQNLIVANENNSMIIDNEGITIEANKLTIKGIQGQDYSFTSYFEMVNNQISLGVKDAKKYTDAQIKITDGKIAQKVSNSEFNTYKEQTANSISQKVSKGSEFSTEFSQNANGFDFKIGNNGTNIQMDRNGMVVRNGGIAIKNNSGKNVLEGDTDGNLKVSGKFTTQGENYKLELASNKLIGFKGNETYNPMYSAGVWWPNGYPTGYVSVGATNAEQVDTNGALWMTSYLNDPDKSAGIQYMKKNNDGNYTSSIIEFASGGSISLVGQKTTGGFRYGLWSHPDGYIYPYQGDEQIGSDVRPWNKVYCNNLYYKNYSTSFSSNILKESSQVETLNNEVSKTLANIEAEKYKDDNSFYTFYRDKFESLVYTDINNDCRLVVDPRPILDDSMISLLVSKNNEDLLLDINGYITSLSMALKRCIEKIECLQQRIKILEESATENKNTEKTE